MGNLELIILKQYYLKWINRYKKINPCDLCFPNLPWRTQPLLSWFIAFIKGLCPHRGASHVNLNLKISGHGFWHRNWWESEVSGHSVFSESITQMSDHKGSSHTSNIRKRQNLWWTIFLQKRNSCGIGKSHLLPSPTRKP